MVKKRDNPNNFPSEVILHGPNGNQFSIKIVNYQFPEIAHDKDDSNWLMISTFAAIRGRSWQTIDPCLSTVEIISLISWISAIKSGNEAETEINFVEPNLSFKFKGRNNGSIVLQVFFELENRPSWAPSHEVEEDLYVDLECTPNELEAWVESLQQQLAKFPPRGF